MNFQNVNEELKVVISVGDESGIGPEIILKALCSNEIPDNIDFTLIGSKKNLIDAFNFDVHYVSLYDHPDCYDNLKNLIDFRQALDNPTKKVLLGKYSHWITTASTTCTFAVKKKVLMEDYEYFKKMCKRDVPRDHKIFTQLTNKGRLLITPIPSLSTHIEKNYLAPLVNWKSSKF